MRVSIRKKVTGIPDARLAIAPGVSDLGAPGVTANISALDAHGFPEAVATLRLSPDEARDLAARLVEGAAVAESIAARAGGVR